MKLIFEKSVPGRRCTILPPLRRGDRGPAGVPAAER